jgi:hypothetical protein
MQFRSVLDCWRPVTEPVCHFVFSSSFTQQHELCVSLRSDPVKDVLAVRELAWEKVYRWEGSQQIKSGGNRYSTNHEVLTQLVFGNSGRNLDSASAFLPTEAFPFWKLDYLPQFIKDDLRVTCFRVPYETSLYSVSDVGESQKTVANVFQKGTAFGEYLVRNFNECF